LRNKAIGRIATVAAAVAITVAPEEGKYAAHQVPDNAQAQLVTAQCTQDFDRIGGNAVKEKMTMVGRNRKR
jgi:hypothetical protein